MVICSLVSPSYDPHLAIWRLIHDVVMIAGFNIVLICHYPGMTCCYLRVDQLDPDTFIISYLMLNRSIFIIIWDGSPPDLIFTSISPHQKLIGQFIR